MTLHICLRIVHIGHGSGVNPGGLSYVLSHKRYDAAWEEGSSVTIEQWRAAISRWGEPVLGLALLLTPHQPAAEATTVKVFANTLATAPDGELEDALYTALWQQRRRFRQLGGRRGALPRELNRVAAPDRFLLGLWLLRGLDGARIATITGVVPDEIVARLTHALQRFVPQPDAPADEATHLTLPTWIAQQLGLARPKPEHPRPCLPCQVVQARFASARDELRQLLGAALRQTHLSLASCDAIEDSLSTRQGAAQPEGWRQRRIWVPALITLLGLLLLLFMPWGGNDRAQAPVATQPRVVVQAALDAWLAQPLAGPSHQRVWARDPHLHNGTPVVTNIWLAGQNDPRHRIEVHREGELVEWQVADGRGRFDYGARRPDSSCRWNIGRQGSDERLHRAPLKFSLAPDEQRAVRDARLMQGAYGTGYLMLQRALAAADLRSFGARREGNTRLVLLQFTDKQMEPERQIVLRIDPQRQQLYAVQEVQAVAAQAESVDLWRLEVNERLTGDVPSAIPPGPAPLESQQLVEPACPALDTAFLISPRTLLGIARPSYVPEALPPGIDKIALFSGDPRNRAGSGLRELDRRLILQVAGPGRWFSLSDIGGAEYGDRRDELSVGPWRATLHKPTTDGLWSGTLRLATDEGRSFTPPFEYWARGWTEDELLALISTLTPLDPARWIDLDDALLEPAPLPRATYETITRALAALQPEPGHTIQSTSTTTVRVEPHVPELPDPYHMPHRQRFPATLVRHQWLVYQGRHISRYHERRVLPDDTLYELLQDDGTRFHWYNSIMGQTYTGSSGLLRAYMRAEQTGVALISAFLTSTEPIKTSETETGLLLEQEVYASFVTDESRGGPPLAHTPWRGQLWSDSTGRFVQQLLLDRDTYRPRSFATIHWQPDGIKAVVRETTINAWQSLATPPADLFALTGLPPDQFTIDVGADNDVPLASITPPQRVLMWPDNLGLEIVEQTPPPSAQNSTLPGGISSDWALLQNVLGTYTTTYRTSERTEVRLTQGPSDVLRHVLRYQFLANDDRQIAQWSSSQRIPVTIAGRARDAWLLQNDANAVLVVEVDDLLLHFKGPQPYLTGPLLEQLPQLQWTMPAP